MPKRHSLWSLALAFSLCLTLALPADAQERQRIERASDMPRFTYPVRGSLESLVRDEKAFAAFAAQVRRDIESVLARYDIADRAMQRQLHGTLLQLDVLDGRDADALARIETLRALQDKPADKLLAGLQARAVVDARKAVGNDTSPEYRAEVRRRIAEALQAMPYDVVANDVKEAKMGAELMGEALALGRVRDVLQPVVDQSGSLSSELAPALVSSRYSLVTRLPLKQTLVESYAAYLAEHKVEKPDIWAARGVDLPPGKGHAPVTVAVWDSGVDAALFGRQAMRDRAGRPLFIAFDKYGHPSRSELAPIPAPLRSKLPSMLARSKGFSDLQSNIDSPEASEVKQYLSTLKPEAYKAAIEEIILTGIYEHGTHVAGIALAGNPHARLLPVRIEFSHTLLPDPCPSRAQAERDARAALASIEFIKRQRARVVNMSWGGSVTDVESDLEKCGIGKTPEERKALARDYFKIARDALAKGFAGAPDILWITAAGNSNEDATFAESLPADIVLPNLLAVGAVDRAGDEASFTSYGPTVKVHANGYQVESFVPGGQRIAISGTSMAAPQVANLAAKLLSVHPRLRPAEVIELIVSTAEKTPDGRRTLIHPARAMQAAQARLAR